MNISNLYSPFSIVALAIVFAACGNESETTTSTSAPLGVQLDTPCGSRLSEPADFCSYISDVPDFDQLRQDALPGGGRMHCLPANAANVLTWLSKRGHLTGYEAYHYENIIDTRELTCSSDARRRDSTELCSATIAWLTGESPEDILGDLYPIAVFFDELVYDGASALIEELGYEMGTQGMSEPDDTPDGTGTELDSFLSVLRDRVGPPMRVTAIRNAHCNTDPFSPRTINRAIENGKLTTLTIGRYSDTDGNGYEERVGGHMVTVMGALKSGTVREIYFRDPARLGVFGDIDRLRQDNPAMETGTVEYVETSREVLNAAGTQESTCDDIMRWKITWANGARTGYLDNLTKVQP